MKRWPTEVGELRALLVSCCLTEERNWNKPCFTHNGKNIAIIQEMNDFVALMFFKGALLEDPDGILHDQGPNSRSARRMQFGSAAEVIRLAPTLQDFVESARRIEDEGLEGGPAPEMVPVKELQSRLDGDSEFRAAFRALTPGRQREYNLYFSGAKQSVTRADRIEKYAEKIFGGKGLRER